VFLTPSVVKEPSRLAQITKDKEREFEVSEKRFSEGEILVKFKEGVTDKEAQEIISKQGAAMIKYFEGIKVYHLRLRSGQDVEEAVNEFSKIPEVQYAEPNYRMRLQQPQ
jgi:predicted Fe-Mo cluster-binding NifX family protein